MFETIGCLFGLLLFVPTTTYQLPFHVVSATIPQAFSTLWGLFVSSLYLCYAWCVVNATYYDQPGYEFITMLLLGTTMPAALQLFCTRAGRIPLSRGRIPFPSFLHHHSWWLSLVLMLYVTTPVDGAVVCHTCFDQIEGCAGGAACPFLTGTATNLTVSLATAGLGITYSITNLLPVEYCRVATRSILDMVLTVLKRPIGAALDLRGKSIDALLKIFKDETAPRREVVL